MKTSKRALSLVLSLLLLLSLSLPQALAEAPQSGTCGDSLTWSFRDGTLTISGTGAMEFDGSPPWYDLAVKKVVLEEGITSLCYGAFGWCEDLKSVKLPKSLKKIGADAFTGTSLKSVSVAKGSKYFSVKDGVLFDKKQTTLYYYPTKKKGSSYTVPSGVKTIAKSAFSGEKYQGGENPYLNKLVLPKKLKKIKEGAFAWSNITTFRFPSGNPAIEDLAFDGLSMTIQYPKKHKKCWTAAVKSIMSSYRKYDGAAPPSIKLKAY